MIVRCECGEKIDIDNTVLAIWYLKGGPIKCPNCKQPIYFNEEENKNVE